MRNGTIFWGVLLVLLGGILLAQNIGLIPPSVNLWSIFWSLVLVMVGVGMLLRAVRGRSARSAEVESLRLPLQGIRQATICIHHGAGELRINGNAQPDELLNGTFGGGIDHRISGGTEAVTVDLRVPTDNFPPFIGMDPSQRIDWTVGLNPNIPLMLDLEVGASRSILDLRDLQVKNLKLQTGASATEIEFPAHAGETRGILHSGAASLEARIPEGVSARIHTSGALSSIDINLARFPRTMDGNEYRSPDYDQAVNRLELEIETGVGAVIVR
jgi:hypothetical protein